MQANNLQHPELVRMTDGGIKERGREVGVGVGGGRERESSSASTAFSENHERRVITFFPFKMRIKCHFALKLKHLLDNLHVLHC